MAASRMCFEPGTEPVTQACALIGDGTGDLLCCGTTPSQLRHTGQGMSSVLVSHGANYVHPSSSASGESCWQLGNDHNGNIYTMGIGKYYLARLPFPRDQVVKQLPAQHPLDPSRSKVLPTQRWILFVAAGVKLHHPTH